MRFRLDKVIGDLCVAVVRKASADLSAGAGRVAHRGSSRGAIGGRLAGALRRPKKLVRAERWGAVIDWHSLGQKFLWLIRGTRRQKARPVQLAPSEQQVSNAVARAAERHYRRRDRRRSRRGGR